MASSAFEDPDVQAAQNSYGDAVYDAGALRTSTAHNDAHSDTKNLIAKQAETQISVNVENKQDTSNNNNNVSNQREANLPKPETPNWCLRMFYWIPVRWFAFGGGCALITLSIIDIIASPSFISFFILIYLVFFGIITMIVEAPVFILTRKSQARVFFWCRLLARSWGRAWYYVFVAIICFFEDNIPSILVGIWLLFVAFLMFIYSRLAAVKYVKIYNFIASGSEGNDAKLKFDVKFSELDYHRQGTIGSNEIVKLAAQAGYSLSNSERHAIQAFLDDSCNGTVSKSDFWKQFSTYNTKQKFL